MFQPQTVNSASRSKKVQNLPQTFLKIHEVPKYVKKTISQWGRKSKARRTVCFSTHTPSCETGLCWVCWHRTMTRVLLSVRDLCSSLRGISGLRISSAFVIYVIECVMRWLCTFPRAPMMPWAEWNEAQSSEADGLCQQWQTQLWFNMPRTLLPHTINNLKNCVFWLAREHKVTQRYQVLKRVTTNECIVFLICGICLVIQYTFIKDDTCYIKSKL